VTHPCQRVANGRTPPIPPIRPLATSRCRARVPTHPPVKRRVIFSFHTDRALTTLYLSFRPRAGTARVEESGWGFLGSALLPTPQIPRPGLRLGGSSRSDSEEDPSHSIWQCSQESIASSQIIHSKTLGFLDIFQGRILITEQTLGFLGLTDTDEKKIRNSKFEIRILRACRRQIRNPKSEIQNGRVGGIQNSKFRIQN
jgi:hypothetical protein